ncbi:DUF808 domain-containing protein [Aliikangiella sp. IMCC44359]|uniref:DUF808 domain-containing protein n=1 Tax=Aliikangiella sp. IMCC44359 TaxID=3459125 RepID=UPI00403ADBFA
MPGSSLLTLLDDIATVLDDVAILSKVAAKKTAGVLGDDLALNAEQVSGIRAEREIPVVWAVAKGSFKNKLILVPAALGISAVADWLIIPLLMIGGVFLCFEGVEKIVHHLFHSKADKEAEHEEIIKAVSDPKVDLVKFEKEKIKGAIRTDFILSAEIIVISLSVVKESPFTTQLLVVSGIALLITVVVYGLVAGIVKLDDAGYYLIKKQGEQFWTRFKRALGRGLLVFAPFLMKLLSIVGTAAMFLVGGGIIIHGIPVIKPLAHHFEKMMSSVPAIGDMLGVIAPVITNALVGVLVGAIAVCIVSIGVRLLGKKTKAERSVH